MSAEIAKAIRGQGLVLEEGERKKEDKMECYSHIEVVEGTVTTAGLTHVTFRCLRCGEIREQTFNEEHWRSIWEQRRLFDLQARASFRAVAP